MIPHSKKKCKSFFDMTDKQKKRILERAARLSTEEQIRKYGSPEQKQESGEWDAWMDSEYFEIVNTPENNMKFGYWIQSVKIQHAKELQEAEMMGYKKGYYQGVSDEIECVETAGEHADLRKKLNKLLKK